MTVGLTLDTFGERDEERIVSALAVDEANML